MMAQNDEPIEINEASNKKYAMGIFVIL